MAPSLWVAPGRPFVHLLIPSRRLRCERMNGLPQSLPKRSSSYGTGSTLDGPTSPNLARFSSAPIDARLGILPARGRLSLLRLFLSYAHQDAAGVRKLSADLRR